MTNTKDSQYETIVAEAVLLTSTFAHCHYNSGVAGDDSCGKCGLDLRHPVHSQCAIDAKEKRKRR